MDVGWNVFEPGSVVSSGLVFNGCMVVMTPVEELCSIAGSPVTVEVSIGMVSVVLCVVVVADGEPSASDDDDRRGGAVDSELKVM